jgi:hypothetical protein
LGSSSTRRRLKWSGSHYASSLLGANPFGGAVRPCHGLEIRHRRQEKIPRAREMKMKRSCKPEQFATQRPQDIVAQQFAYRVTVSLAVFVVPAYLADIVTDVE